MKQNVGEIPIVVISTEGRNLDPSHPFGMTPNVRKVAVLPYGIREPK
jgi:hypothetical protein